MGLHWDQRNVKKPDLFVFWFCLGFVDNCLWGVNPNQVTVISKRHGNGLAYCQSVYNTVFSLELSPFTIILIRAMRGDNRCTRYGYNTQCSHQSCLPSPLLWPEWSWGEIICVHDMGTIHSVLIRVVSLHHHSDMVHRTKINRSNIMWHGTTMCKSYLFL